MGVTVSLTDKSLCASFTQQCWENDGSLVNNVGAMHRRLSNNVWTNDGRFHNNVRRSFSQQCMDKRRSF